MYVAEVGKKKKILAGNIVVFIFEQVPPQKKEFRRGGWGGEGWKALFEGSGTKSAGKELIKLFFTAWEFVTAYGYI